MRVLVMIVFVSVAAGEVAWAQATVNDVVGFLMTNQAVPTASPERDRTAAEAARDVVSRALLVNLASVPLATSSGGFLYRFNPAIGTMERAASTFGALFVERALTIGRGRASFGVSTSESSFDRLDGAPLTDGTLLTTANRFRDESAPFDTETLTLDIHAATTTVFGSVGVTDRLEIGGALPLVRLSLEGRRVNVYRGTTYLQASAQASASGVGDAAIRAKYTLVAGGQGSVAAAGELRLPTGDRENLLGAGSRSYRLLGVASYERGAFAVHGNGGIVRGGVSHEVQAGGAASAAVHPRVTVSGEMMLRRVLTLHAVELVAAAHPQIAGVDTLRLSAAAPGTTLMRAVGGVKWNVVGALALGGHLAFPLVEHGLTARVTPTFALEYAF
jgi:hypothetical protein